MGRCRQWQRGSGSSRRPAPGRPRWGGKERRGRRCLICERRGRRSSSSPTSSRRCYCCCCCCYRRRSCRALVAARVVGRARAPSVLAPAPRHQRVGVAAIIRRAALARRRRANRRRSRILQSRRSAPRARRSELTLCWHLSWRCCRARCRFAPRTLARRRTALCWRRRRQRRAGALPALRRRGHAAPERLG